MVFVAVGNKGLNFALSSPPIFTFSFGSGFLFVSVLFDAKSVLLIPFSANEYVLPNSASERILSIIGDSISL
jgi:hypothetical protein